MAATIYLADTTLMVHQNQHKVVRQHYERLLIDGRIAICQMTAMEWLNNAPDPRSYASLASQLQGHRWMDTDIEAMDRALEVHGMLATKSQHRNFSLPDLVIAATAERHGATVLHYDADFERIAAVTGQPVEWVVPAGSL